MNDRRRTFRRWRRLAWRLPASLILVGYGVAVLRDAAPSLTAVQMALSGRFVEAFEAWVSEP